MILIALYRKDNIEKERLFAYQNINLNDQSI